MSTIMRHSSNVEKSCIIAKKNPKQKQTTTSCLLFETKVVSL